MDRDFGRGYSSDLRCHVFSGDQLFSHLFLTTMNTDLHLMKYNIKLFLHV